MSHKTKQGALKAARDALGEHAIEGVDFNVHNTGAGWTYSEMGAATDAAAEAQAKRFKVFREGKITESESTTGLVNVKDIGGAEVWVKDGEPLVVDGVLYPNKTRATEARKAKERAAAEPAKPKERVVNTTASKKPAAPKKARVPKEVVQTSDRASRAPGKGDTIQAMLREPNGSTSEQMEKAVGWKPHSVRGYLGTLRSKGVKITSTKDGKAPTVYRIEEDVV